jgi:hypothetical protein
MSAVIENGFNHGSHLIFPNGSKSFQPFCGEKLKGANLPDLNIVRSIIRPYKVLPILAKHSSRPISFPVSQLLVMLLEYFLSQLRVRHDHVQHGAEPHRYDRAVGLRPLGKAPEPHRLYIVDIADERPRARPRWELES